MQAFGVCVTRTLTQIFVYLIVFVTVNGAVMNGLIQTHPIGLIGFLLLAIVIALGNAIWLKRFGSRVLLQRLPKVSILIPARNEEGNLERCLSSLLAQDYPAFEILVLDDRSTDRTAEIAVRLAAPDGRIQLLRGADLPEGWLGKHWACHQLAQSARGELLLFVDADTWYHPQALSDSVALMESDRLDLLSAVPREEMGSTGEMLLVPYFLFANFAFIPLFLVNCLHNPGFSFTIGQFMLFRRSGYDRIGGHSAVRADVADDLALGRAIVAKRLRWALADATKRMHCRMYHSFGEAWHGFSKNMFAGFGYRLVPYVLIWLWCGFLFCEPLMVLVLAFLGKPPSYFPLDLAVLAYALGCLLWAIPYARLSLPLYWVPIYPLVFLCAFAVALNALTLAFLGGASWKGRAVSRAKIRLF